MAEGPRRDWATPGFDGTISIANEQWHAYPGSGFGHKCNGPTEDQYYSWMGEEIPRTIFEISVSAGPLTAEEEKNLLPNE